MSKQDRQGVRRPADLEQKYSFGSVFKNQAKENARQQSEMNQQNLTMKQFISFASSAIETLQKEVDTAEKLIVALQIAVSSLEGRMTTAEGNIKKHGTRLTTAEENIVSIEENVQKIGKRVTTAESNISKHSTRLANVEADFTALEKRVKALEETETT